MNQTSLVRHVAAGLFVAASLALVGCGQNSESMCKKLEALDAKNPKKDKDKDEKKKDPKEEHADCVKNFDHIKEVSPEAYKKIGNCVDMSDPETAGACLLVVVLGDDKLKEDSEKQSKKDEEDRKKKSAEKIAGWADIKGKATEISFKSLMEEGKTINLTADVPEGFEKDAGMSSDNSAAYMMKEDKDSLMFVTPQVTFRSSFGEPNLDEEVKSLEMLKQKPVKQEKTDKGYTLTSEGEMGLKAQVAVKNGENAVLCEASIYGDDAKPAKDKLLPWLEKICKSMTVK